MVVNCPICNTRSELSYKLDRGKIHAALEEFIGRRVPASIIKADYSMHKCGSCQLEFAHPLVPADANFYTALASEDGYYPHERGEYKLVADHIRQTKGLAASVLDVGCGGGDFLSMMKQEGFTELRGLDATESSVNVCRTKGLSVSCGQIENFAEGPFDAITSFHCLEHVADPVEFIRNAIRLLKNDGCLYISTPYAPQTVEISWFHPLNHPPHHMLRLYKHTYERLAEKTGTSVEFINFGSTSFGSQVRTAYNYAVYGNNTLRSTVSTVAGMVARPLLMMKIITRIRKRIRLYGKDAGPDILVVFRPKKSVTQQ